MNLFDEIIRTKEEEEKGKKNREFGFDKNPQSLKAVLASPLAVVPMINRVC
jgi:hypothetical protein